MAGSPIRYNASRWRNSLRRFCWTSGLVAGSENRVLERQAVARWVCRLGIGWRLACQVAPGAPGPNTAVSPF